MTGTEVRPCADVLPHRQRKRWNGLV